MSQLGWTVKNESLSIKHYWTRLYKLSFLSLPQALSPMQIVAKFGIVEMTNLLSICTIRGHDLEAFPFAYNLFINKDSGLDIKKVSPTSRTISVMTSWQNKWCHFPATPMQPFLTRRNGHPRPGKRSWETLVSARYWGYSHVDHPVPSYRVKEMEQETD